MTSVVARALAGMSSIEMRAAEIQSDEGDIILFMLVISG
jgi:hypothetical protein